LFHGELSTPQMRVFNEIQKFINTLEIHDGKLMGLDQFKFHDPQSIAVDSTIYDILINGEADYGFGSSLKDAVTSSLYEINFHMECQGGGLLNFIYEAPEPKLPGELGYSLLMNVYGIPSILHNGILFASPRASTTDPIQAMIELTKDYEAKILKQTQPDPLDDITHALDDMKETSTESFNEYGETRDQSIEIDIGLGFGNEDDETTIRLALENKYFPLTEHDNEIIEENLTLHFGEDHE